MAKSQTEWPAVSLPSAGLCKDRCRGAQAADLPALRLRGFRKTTYARTLEAQGCARLSIDETVFERHGRHGVDYDEGDYPERETFARTALDRKLLALIESGQDVVLDYGFWSCEIRDSYKELIDTAGACWRLLFFDVPISEIHRRLRERSRRDDANSLFVGDRHLTEFLTRWRPPWGEGEELVASADPSH